MTIRRGVNRAAEFRVNGNCQLNPGGAFRLSSNPLEHFIAHMLRPHTNCVLPRLPGVEPERESKAGFATKRVAFLERPAFIGEIASRE
jgi:hypothetical protein